MVGDMKTETKNSKTNNMFDNVKTNIWLMKDNFILIEHHQTPKELSMTQLWARLETTQTTTDGRDSDLNKDLPATPSSNNQGEVNILKDNIRRLKTGIKKAFLEGTQLEPAHTPPPKRLNQTTKVARMQTYPQSNNQTRQDNYSTDGFITITPKTAKAATKEPELTPNKIRHITATNYRLSRAMPPQLDKPDVQPAPTAELCSASTPSNTGG